MKLSGVQWICVLLLCIVIGLLHTDWFWKTMYPIAYGDEIVDAAQYFEVDPYLILAVVQTESNFRQYRSSPKGAQGLMQLMPETAEWANEKSGLEEEPDAYISDPAINVWLGTWYLSYLLNQYEQNHIQALVAYNAGEGNLNRWLNEGVWDGSAHNLNQIPFGETRHYVARAQYYFQRYQQIYTEDF